MHNLKVMHKKNYLSKEILSSQQIPALKTLVKIANEPGNMSSNSGRENGIMNQSTNIHGKNANTNIVTDMPGTTEKNKQDSFSYSRVK